MEFPPFEHARFLAEGWQHGPPEHNLGASAFVPDDPLEGLPTKLVAEDVGHFELHAGTAFRTAVARHLGLQDDQVRATAGTSAANTAVIAHAVTPGCNVVCETPYYAPLPHTAQGFGAEVRYTDDLIAGIDAETALVIITSPNNPTGRAMRASELIAVAEAAAEHGALVLVDQVYRELTDHAVAAGLHPALVSTGSLNKCWGAPGLRAGWVAGDPELMDTLEEVHRTLLLGASSPGTRLGTALLALGDERRAQLEARLAENHPVYETWCGDHGIEPALGALTAFPQIPAKDTWKFAKAALADGILTIPGEAFGQPGHLRIGLGIPTEQLSAGLEALSSRW